MCLRAVSIFAAQQKTGELKFDYKIGNGKTVNASTGLPLAQIEIPVSGLKEQAVMVNNQSGGSLFTRVIKTGVPARGEEREEANNLTMNVAYTDMNGAALDPGSLEQGTQFVAEVSIRHPGVRGPYENLALSQVYPSGWEINNLRLGGDEGFLKNDVFTYQDIRDDRVFTYFNLSPGESRTFRILVTAAYAGQYYLPAVSCEAMYDPGIYARTKGRDVRVVKASK